MARDEPARPEPGALAALYLRTAATLERSAGLAEQHAARLSGEGRDELAKGELEQAERALAAARRCREHAARMQ